MTYVLTTDDITVGDAVTAQLEKMWGWYLAGGIISVIFGGWGTYNQAPWWGWGNWVLVVLIFLLGWGVYGFAIR